MPDAAVRLDASTSTGPLDDLPARVARAARPGEHHPTPPDERTHVERGLDLARYLGHEVARPGGGQTLSLWSVLATLGAADLTVARTVEPHLDAVAIWDEARAQEQVEERPAHDATWGVYAAEGGPHRLRARENDGEWHLSGVKPWCSLAGSVSHALVTAWVDDERRGLFSVSLRASQDGSDPVPEPVPGVWVPRGLSDVPSLSLHLDRVPATPVGGPGWYLERSGFAWGGMGVAAVWFGATVALARRLRDAARARQADQVALMHLGAIDIGLSSARAALVTAAADVDGGRAEGADGALLAQRVRGTVAAVAEDVLRRVGHGLGPAPLALEEEHAERVAALGLYLRQHHAERDEAALGADVLAGGPRPPVVPGPWRWT